MLEPTKQSIQMLQIFQLINLFPLSHKILLLYYKILSRTTL